MTPTLGPQFLRRKPRERSERSYGNSDIPKRGHCLGTLSCVLGRPQRQKAKRGYKKEHGWKQTDMTVLVSLSNQKFALLFMLCVIKVHVPHFQYPGNSGCTLLRRVYLWITPNLQFRRHGNKETAPSSQSSVVFSRLLPSRRRGCPSQSTQASKPSPVVAGTHRRATTPWFPLVSARINSGVRAPPYPSTFLGKEDPTLGSEDSPQAGTAERE
jgi:hypothetical protein